MSEALIASTVSTEFARVSERLIAIAEEINGFGAHLAITHRGQLVVDLQVGEGLAPRPLSPIFSATKGAAAMVIAMLVDRGELDLAAPVIRYWPEFGEQDKQDVRVDELLSHQAGLVAAPGLTAAELIESIPAAERLAAARPLWRPGTAVGYHGLTIGVFMEEIVRRVTGGRLQDIYEEAIRAPRDIDVYLGLPEQLHPRHVKSRYPVDPPVPPLPPTADDLGAYAFLSVHQPFLLNEGDLDPFSPTVRASGFGAGGGAASGLGLAQLYAAAIGELGAPLFTNTTIERMVQLQAYGPDLVLGAPSAFGTVFARPHPGNPFGSYRAFGHDGAGGVVAFADPLHRLTFAYVPDPMELAPAHAHELSNIARQCARDSL